MSYEKHRKCLLVMAIQRTEFKPGSYKQTSSSHKPLTSDKIKKKNLTSIIASQLELAFNFFTLMLGKQSPLNQTDSPSPQTPSTPKQQLIESSGDSLSIESARAY